MLPKVKRLTVHDFKAGGRFVCYSTPYFDVKVKRSDITKYAVVTLSKRFKKAVERNKIRRRYYALLAECVPQQPAFIVMYPKSETSTVTYSHLLETLKKVYTDNAI